MNKKLRGKFIGRIARFLKDRSGLALTEFAYSLPIFTGLGMYGLETAHFTVMQMRVSQISLNLADNASRMGQSASSSSSKTVFETDVSQMLTGAALQGEGIDFTSKGRVILSSLERNALGQQYIRWARCFGGADHDTKYYNPETELRPFGFDGMGESGTKITAQSGTAVMFVEIMYDYEPLFGDLFMDARTIRHQAAFNVRDNRNIVLGVVSDGSTKASCGNLLTWLI